MKKYDYRELSQQEKEKPYSKYFYKEWAQPEPEAFTPFNEPMDNLKALIPEKANDLLNPGYLDAEAGWCVLSNGVGYLANQVKMPGVSVDMVNWWFGWHGLEPLRYKIWYPQDHYHVSVSDEHRKIILDPKTPAVKKFQGLTHTVIESIGSGADKITINFLPPEDFGFDMERFKAPAVGTLVGANVFIKSSFFLPKVPVIMFHFIREIEGGVEFRSRFWVGYTLVNKKPKRKLPPFVKVPGEMLKKVGKHNVYEYTNLASFLPQLYDEQKGIIA